MLALLSRGRAYTTKELAAYFQQSVRNTTRDLQIARQSGVPITWNPHYGEHGGFEIAPGFMLPPMPLEPEECISLSMVSRAAEAQTVPLMDDVRTLRAKIEARLSKPKRELIEAVEELYDVLSIGTPDHGQCKQVMLMLQDALLRNKQVEGIYLSPHRGSPEKVSLQPRKLFLGGGVWRCVAFCNRTAENRTYRLHRFKSIKVTIADRTVQSRFDLTDYLGNAWLSHRGDPDIDVEIVFDHEVAPVVAEVRWHRTQQIDMLADGRCRFTAKVSGTTEIRIWILGWGPHAKVVGPPSLAREVKALAEATAAQYQEGRSIDR